MELASAGSARGHHRRPRPRHSPLGALLPKHSVSYAASVFLVEPFAPAAAAPFMNIFLKGLLLGFSIAAPVGPIGVLCIRRTLAEGRTAGFASGLGAATADALYGSIAGFGLTIVSSFLIDQSHWLQLAGGIFLLYLGIKTFLAKSKETIETGSPLEKSRGIIGNYASTFLLTLTNPLTILSFIAIFAGDRKSVV